jgi:hypothetical protein
VPAWIGQQCGRCARPKIPDNLGCFTETIGNNLEDQMPMCHMISPPYHQYTPGVAELLEHHAAVGCELEWQLGETGDLLFLR